MGTRGTKSTHTGSSTGTGISYQDFWLPLQHAMANRGWSLINTTDFALAAKKSDWVVAMIDGDANIASDSFDHLDQWADGKKIARSRLLVAVFAKARKTDVDTITKLQRGTRMLPQAMGAVIHIQEGRFYRPDVPGITWHGSKYPIFDEQVGGDIEAALHEVLRPR